MNTSMTPDELNERRVKARRYAMVLGLVAFAFYVAFIAMSVAKS